MGKSGIFSPDSRNGGLLTSVPNLDLFPPSLLTKHLRYKFKEMMAPIEESHHDHASTRGNSQSRPLRTQFWIMAVIDFFDFQL